MSAETGLGHAAGQLDAPASSCVSEAIPTPVHHRSEPKLPFFKRFWVWVFSLLAGSVLLRLWCLDFESGDYRAFLGPWYEFYLRHGRWHGLSLLEPNATYAPLYLSFISLSTLLPIPKLYAIKLFSIAADYVAAWYVWRLARRVPLSKPAALGAVAAFLFLPTVVMNGALWGQCDILYTTGFLASLYYLLHRRPMAALAAFGVSCALKPQAIFWCPLLLGLLLNGRVPWRGWWVPPAVVVGCGLPALLAGRPVKCLLGALSHGSAQPLLTFGATNWYQWLNATISEGLALTGVLLTVALTIGFAFWVRGGPPPAEPAPNRRVSAENSITPRPPVELSGIEPIPRTLPPPTEARWLVALALLSVLFPPFLLPGMHERYFFAADVISVVYAMYIPGGWRAAYLVQSASAFSYLPYLFHEQPIPLGILAVVIVAAIALVVRDLWRARPIQPKAIV